MPPMIINRGVIPSMRKLADSIVASDSKTCHATHVCVESTFRQAHDLGYDTTVVIDATSAFNRAHQDYFAKNIVHHFGHALTAEEFAKMLSLDN